jgi:hypothetical protein
MRKGIARFFTGGSLLVLAAVMFLPAAVRPADAQVKAHLKAACDGNDQVPVVMNGVPTHLFFFNKGPCAVDLKCFDDVNMVQVGQGANVTPGISRMIACGAPATSIIYTPANTGGILKANLFYY